MARTIKGRLFGGNSRLREQAKNNLGIIMTDIMNRNQQFRDPNLDLMDAYYENRQYDDLVEWDQAASNEDYIPVRKRKPRIIYNVAKLLVTKVAAKLVGSAVFPTFVVEDDADDTDFFRVVQTASNFRANLVQPFKHLLTSGSVFVRFYLVNGLPIIEHYNAKFCYPVFDAANELETLEVRYVFSDPDDKDSQGVPKKKWYRMILSKTVDILYDTPDYREGAGIPDFQEVERNEHGLGWVQGEWFRTEKHKFSPDGPAIFADVLDFIDDLNYSLSQTSQAVAYNQEPQLAVNGVDEDELDNLIRSSQKAWNLGKDGKAAFVNSDLKGVEQAGNTRDHFRNRMLEVVRVVILDAEKIVGNAQSGKAMELMHGPLVELIDELRGIVEPNLRNLLVKLGLTLLAFGERGQDTVLDVPNGYIPSSLDLTLQWPAIFPVTIDDIKNKIAAAAQATTAKILSREWATRWIAQDVGIEDVEEELQRIAAEPDLNPFGSFGGGGGFGGK